VLGDVVDFLGERGLHRRAVEGVEFFQRRDPVHSWLPVRSNERRCNPADHSGGAQRELGSIVNEILDDLQNLFLARFLRFDRPLRKNGLALFEHDLEGRFLAWARDDVSGYKRHAVLLLILRAKT
jgi:hypothetical protein